MRRRTFLASALSLTQAGRLSAAVADGRWDAAASALAEAVESKQVESAVLHVKRGEADFAKAFGKAASADAMFLLGSISKPINVAALMTLYDQGAFRLDDRVKRFLPEFQGDGRDDVTMRHLLTHTSGLPDQLPGNNELRRRHAPLSEFVAQALRAPLAFVPGSLYQYASMGILLASRVGEFLSGMNMLTLVQKRILDPLGMQHSSQGLGQFRLEDLVRCQMEGAAPESGGGDPTAREWDWNSRYWRTLGAPWGGTHASAPDLALFLGELMHARGAALKPATARLITQNHNPPGLTSRGLGFAVGLQAGSQGCSAQTFGHTGSTGTLFWADPAHDTTCVVLTSLPGRGLKIHPRERAGQTVARAMQG